MRYEILVAGTPKRRGPRHRHRAHDRQPAPLSGSIPYPPQLQFTSEAPEGLVRHLRKAAEMAFGEGMALRTLCREIYHRARTFGYTATLKVYPAARDTKTGKVILIEVSLAPVTAKKGRFYYRAGAEKGA